MHAVKSGVFDEVVPLLLYNFRFGRLFGPINAFFIQRNDFAHGVFKTGFDSYIFLCFEITFDLQAAFYDTDRTVCVFSFWRRFV